MSHKYDDVVFGKVDPDMGFRVGDLVYTYYKHIWRITKIEKRFYEIPSRYRQNWPIGAPLPSILHFRKVASEDGTLLPNSKATNRCCATHCILIDRDYIERERKITINEAQLKAANLITLLEN